MAKVTALDEAEIGDTVVVARIKDLRIRKARGERGHVAFFELHEINSDRCFDGMAFPKAYRQCGDALRAGGPLRCEGKLVLSNDEHGNQHPLFLLDEAFPI